MILLVVIYQKLENVLIVVSLLMKTATLKKLVLIPLPVATHVSGDRVMGVVDG